MARRIGCCNERSPGAHTEKLHRVVLKRTANQARASRMILKGVSAALRTWRSPAE